MMSLKKEEYTMLAAVLSSLRKSHGVVARARDEHDVRQVCEALHIAGYRVISRGTAQAVKKAANLLS